MKTRTKNFFFTTLIIVTVLSLTFGALYILMPGFYRERKIEELIQLSDTIYQQLNGKDLTEKEEILLNQLSEKKSVSISIKDQQGNFLYGPDRENQQLGLGDMVINSRDAGQPTEELMVPDQESMRVLFYVKGGGMLKTGEKITIYVTYPVAPIDDATEILLSLYPSTLLIATVIGSIGAFLYSWFASKRVAQIIQTTQKMTDIHGAELISVKGKDEISELARNINYLYTGLIETIHELDEEKMEVAESERSKAEFMRSASHELKTPLTAVNSLLEGMYHNIGDYKNHKKYLSVCQQIIKEQAELIDRILYISKIDMLGVQQEKEHFSFEEVYQDTQLVYEILAKNEGKQLQSIIEDFEIWGVKEDFVRIWNNIFSNALKYSTAQGKITLKAEKNYLELYNEGKILNEQDQKQVFQPFYRPDYARAREDGGTGLGLYIVSQLVQRNNWRCSFEVSTDRTGMVFKLYLD